jgi:transcriptional regulator with XRE-family HTH domain
MKVLRLRKLRGITQAQLADACGTTQQQIAKIEQLVADPRHGTLVRLAEALDCEIHDLFYKPDEFVQLVNQVIEANNLDLKREVFASLASKCQRAAHISSFDPLWQRCKVKNNSIDIAKRGEK